MLAWQIDHLGGTERGFRPGRGSGDDPAGAAGRVGAVPVPLYQRTYSWQKWQLRRLWEDILQLASDRAVSPGLTHFIGSLVLAPSPANGPVGVTEFLVVDGQQRLTTLSLLLCTIRDHRAQTEDPQHHERINERAWR